MLGMKQPVEEIAAIFLAKAEESLAGAESEYANGRYNNCANRCYYACFQETSCAAGAPLRMESRLPEDTPLKIGIFIGGGEPAAHDSLLANPISVLVSVEKTRSRYAQPKGSPAVIHALSAHQSP